MVDTLKGALPVELVDRLEPRAVHLRAGLAGWVVVVDTDPDAGEMLAIDRLTWPAERPNLSVARLAMPTFKPYKNVSEVVRAIEDRVASVEESR